MKPLTTYLKHYPKDARATALLFYRSYAPAFLTHKLEFRKALILGVDWDAVVKAFYPPEVGERQSGGAPLFSRVTLGYDPEIPPYPYNPEEAKRLLKAAGYAGEKITFWTFFFAARSKIVDWQPSNGSPTVLAFETLKPTPIK